MYEYYFKENGSIKNFIKLLEERDFIVQKGKLRYIDILKLASEGKSDTALGNIVRAPYATYLLPPAPNQEPSPRQRPPRAMILTTQIITRLILILLRRVYPADEYFSECYKNDKYYYVMKMARNSTEGNEIIIPYSFQNFRVSNYQQ